MFFHPTAIQWALYFVLQIFRGNTAGHNDTVTRKVEPAIAGRAVKFIPLTWYGMRPCMRVEICGNGKLKSIHWIINKHYSLKLEVRSLSTKTRTIFGAKAFLITTNATILFLTSAISE